MLSVMLSAAACPYCSVMTPSFSKILPLPQKSCNLPSNSEYIADLLSDDYAFEFQDSIVWTCESESGDSTKIIFDLSVEPDTTYRKLLYLLSCDLDEWTKAHLTELLSGRKSYMTFTKQLLDLDCNDTQYTKECAISYCTNKEYRRQIADILYERQDPLARYAAWENFDRKRCPWYESYRDSILKNGSKHDLSMLLVLCKNANDKEEFELLWKEYDKLEDFCLYKKGFRYILDNSDVITFRDFRSIPEFLLHGNQYGFYRLTYYSRVQKDYDWNHIWSQMQRGYAMFVTELSCLDEMAQQKILLNLEIPQGSECDLDKCIETVERENPVDEELKKKVLKALRKAQGN